MTRGPTPSGPGPCGPAAGSPSSRATSTLPASMLEESRGHRGAARPDPVQGYVALYTGMIAVYRNEVEAAIPSTGRRWPGTGPPATWPAWCSRYAAGSSATPARRVRARRRRRGRGHRRVRRPRGGMAQGVHDVRARRRGVAPGRHCGAPPLWNRRACGSTARSTTRLGVAVGEEVLAWIAATGGNHERAALLMGIRRRTWQAISAPLSGYRESLRYHEESEARVRPPSATRPSRPPSGAGRAMPDDEALAYALEERPALRPVRRAPLRAHRSPGGRRRSPGSSPKA